MRKEVDFTRSKNPIVVEDETDLAKKNLEIADIGQRIDALEDLGTILQLEDKARAVKKFSELRTLQLVEEMLKTPFSEKTMIIHAEIRGRIGERFRVTKELQGIFTFRERLKQQKELAKTAMGNMAEKIRKRMKGKK